MIDLSCPPLGKRNCVFKIQMLGKMNGFHIKNDNTIEIIYTFVNLEDQYIGIF